MDITTTFTTILALVLIFLFAIQKFGHQIERVAGKRLREVFHNFTNRPSKAIAVGTLVSSILPSSMAISVILVDLVNAGIIASYNAIGVVVGANLGIIVTSQLIALNMTYVAPIVVIIGFIVSHTHSKFKKYGKAVFYFGVIFLALFIISILIEPLKSNPQFLSFLQSISNPYEAIIIGAVLTIMVQSGALFAGLVLILANGNLIGLPEAVGFLLGCGITPALTAVVASTSATLEAKKVAIANAYFNIGGVILFAPFLYPFIKLLQFISTNEVQQIVNATFIFNVSIAILCFVFFKYFDRLVEKTTVLLYKK
ncbi:MAG: Na/Pi symporter [Patescibacteria group bacterium]